MEKSDARRKRPPVPRMNKRDRNLLEEYGFKPRSISSVKLNMKKIDKMTMRQLDRTKMLLLRNSDLCGGLPDKVLEGIKRNELSTYAEALSLIAPALKRPYSSASDATVK